MASCSTWPQTGSSSKHPEEQAGPGALEKDARGHAMCPRRAELIGCFLCGISGRYEIFNTREQGEETVCPWSSATALLADRPPTGPRRGRWAWPSLDATTTTGNGGSQTLPSPGCVPTSSRAPVPVLPFPRELYLDGPGCRDAFPGQTGSYQP